MDAFLLEQGEEIDSAEAEALFYDPDDDWQKDVDLSATPLRATVTHSR